MQAVWSHSYHGIQHMAISNNMAGYRIGIVFLVLSYYLYKPATKSEHYSNLLSMTSSSIVICSLEKHKNINFSKIYSDAFDKQF